MYYGFGCDVYVDVYVFTFVQLQIIYFSYIN